MHQRLQKTGFSNRYRAARQIVLALGVLLSFGTPAFAQVGADRVSQFLSNALSYAQGLGIFGAGFLVIWAVAKGGRERGDVAVKRAHLVGSPQLSNPDFHSFINHSHRALAQL